MALNAGTRLGPYAIVAPLGAGGMGEVYRAHDERLEREVAVKVLPKHLVRDPEALARFEREAKALAALSHPNILAIHDIGKEGDLCYVVTELLDGETLRQRLKQSAVSWRRAAEIATAIAEGLAAAHSKRIIHRDLKPENIFLTADGRVKILDFGLARIRSKQVVEPDAPTLLEKPDSGLKTEPGTVMGTVGYMSPEQVRAEPAEEPSDIFSLGCMLYEMVSGQRPFERSSFVESMTAVLKEELPDLAGPGKQIPAELDGVIAHCVEKRAQERFQSARDLAFALRAISSTARASESMKAPGPARVRLPRYAWAAAAAVLLAAAGGLGWWWTAGRATVRSIAVLPFVNAAGDPNADYVSDGITEAIIKNLSQLPNLGVMSRSSVFRYKGREVDPQTAGRALKVQAVLVGRLQMRGDNLAISTELVDPETNRQIWGEQYNRKLTDLMAVQEEISREISEKLSLRLSGTEKQMLARRATENSAAYQLYLQGRYQWNKRTLEGMQQAIEHFQQAAQRDPRYALAQAGLADAYALLADYNVLPAREVMPRAKAAAIQAIQLDEGLAEAHASLGWVKLSHDWAFADAERELKRSIELNGKYAASRQWYGEYLLLTGRTNEAVAELKRAQELEPLLPAVHQSLGLALYYSGQHDAAAEQARKILAIDSNFTGAYMLLGRVYGEKGDHAEALTQLQKALDLSQGNTNEFAALGLGYGRAGRRNQALQVLSDLQERSKQTYVQPAWLAVIYAALGQKEQALEWLNRAYEDRSGWLVYLKADPSFQPLRSEPRFQELVRRVGL